MTLEELAFILLCEDCVPQWRKATPDEPWERVRSSQAARQMRCRECGDFLGEYHWSVESKSGE